MSIYLSFYNDVGRIVSVNTYDDDVTPSEIAALTPVGGGYYEGLTDPDRQWFDATVLSDRPMLTAESQFQIDADGVDNVTIVVPSGTEIVRNTATEEATETAGEDFVYTSPAPAADQFTLTPPFPYIPADFWIFSGEVGSKTYQSVHTDDVSDGAITPIKSDLGNPGNGFVDNNCEEPDLWTSSRSGAGALATITSEPNVDGTMGSSRGKLTFTFDSLAALESYSILGEPVNQCTEGKRYTFSTHVHFLAGMDPLALCQFRIDWYGLDSSGEKVFISTSTEYDQIISLTITAPPQAKFSVIAPDGAMFFAYRLDGSVTSAGTFTIEIGGIDAHEANIAIFETATFAGTESVNAGNTKTFMLMRCNHTKGARYVQIAYCLKNNTGGGRNPQFEIIKITDPTGTPVTTVLKSMSYSLQDDNMTYAEFFDNNPTGDFTDYGLRITAAALSFSANNRFMTTQAYLG